MTDSKYTPTSERERALGRALEERGFFMWLIQNGSNPIWATRSPEQEIARVALDLLATSAATTDDREALGDLIESEVAHWEFHMREGDGMEAPLANHLASALTSAGFARLAPLEAEIARLRMALTEAQRR